MIPVVRRSEGDRTLLCADVETEKRLQRIRMVAWAIGGPSLIFLAAKTPARMPAVRLFLLSSGVACTAYHFAVWRTVDKAIAQD
jgi:hypothetical protein